MPDQASPSDDHAGPRPNPRGPVGTAYMLALSLIALLVLAGQAMTTRHLASMEDTSRTINLAGRQRMLSLTIGQAILLAAKPSDQARQRGRHLLAESLEPWQRVHQGLINGATGLGLRPSPSPRAQHLLEEMESPRRQVLKAARQILDALDTAAPGTGAWSRSGIGHGVTRRAWPYLCWISTS